jgi:hypothetical protein
MALGFVIELIKVYALTMLARQSSAISCYISIDTLRLLLGKLWDVVPVLLQAIRDLVRGLGITQLQDRVVVECPILSLLVLAPNLLSFDSKNLDSDSARRGNVVRDELWGERRVAHDAVVGAGFCKHALGEVRWEVVVDDELSEDTLPACQ